MQYSVILQYSVITQYSVILQYSVIMQYSIILQYFVIMQYSVILQYSVIMQYSVIEQYFFIWIGIGNISITIIMILQKLKFNQVHRDSPSLPQAGAISTGLLLPTLSHSLQVTLLLDVSPTVILRILTVTSREQFYSLEDLMLHGLASLHR